MTKGAGWLIADLGTQRAQWNQDFVGCTALKVKGKAAASRKILFEDFLSRKPVTSSLKQRAMLGVDAGTPSRKWESVALQYASCTAVFSAQQELSCFCTPLVD